MSQCPACKALRAQNERLAEELEGVQQRIEALGADSAIEREWSELFGETTQAVRIIRELYLSERVVPYDTLSVVIRRGRAGCDVQDLRTRVNLARKLLEDCGFDRGLIKNQHNEGYYMPKGGKPALEQALTRFVEAA